MNEERCWHIRAAGGRLRLEMVLMEALTHLKVFREDELDQKRRGDANHTVTTGANGKCRNRCTHLALVLARTTNSS